MSEDDIEQITKYYKAILTTDPLNPVDPKDVGIDELLNCLSPDNAVERIMYRKDIAN